MSMSEVGSYGDISTSYQLADDYIDLLERMRVAEIGFQEKLNALKISNVQNLGRLQRAEEEKLMAAHLAQIQLAMEEEKRQAADRIKAVMNEKKLSGELSEAQFEDELARRLAAVDEEFARRLKHKQQEAKDDLNAAKKKERDERKKAKEDEKRKKNELKSEAKERANDLFGANKSFSERKAALKEMAIARDKDGNELDVGKGGKALALTDALTHALSDLGKQLDSKIDKISEKKGLVDTRLQGAASGDWDTYTKKITGIAGVSPLLKQSALADRVSSMVGEGIAFNVLQRATLQEMSSKIATTFSATNSTLLRMVRIQQEDTTAGRLGMESALTAFLNNMYETTEYMSSIAASIKGSLEESMALMSGKEAVEFEYQVQKWLGSLYSVGMSDSSVQKIGGSLGKLAAGQLEGITSGGEGNLIIMAANNAGLNVSDLLANGLNDDTTNQLMTAMVDYLAKIYEEAGNSKVVQQQFADVFGLTASDLKAIANLAPSTSVISRDGLSYSSAMGRLNSMANSMGKRTSMGEMLSNMWDNVQYSMAAGIASNPALYGLYKAAGLLDTVAGGIALPDIKVMGSGVNLQTTVADLMRVGAMSGGILSSIGQMVTAGGGGGLTGGGILKAAGIDSSGISQVTRGNGSSLSTAGGMTVSESGTVVGNSDGSAVQDKTMTDATDDGNSQLVEAVDSNEETKLNDVNNSVINIYNLLLDLVEGGALKVKVDGSVEVSNMPATTW